ncbi:MAG: flagellar export protein FliJ [Methylocystis sp.]
MKSRDTLVRLKRFQTEEKRRRVIQLNGMIAEFTRMANELGREIGQEERRANISDLNHFAYPTYARAARARRDNILASINELRGQLDEAEAQYKEASEDLAKTQNQDARDRGAERMIDVVADRRHVERSEAFRRA